MSHSAEPDEDQPHQPIAQRRAHSHEAPVRPAQRLLSRWATLAPTLIAVVALGVAIWALLRSPSDTPQPPSAQQVADAKGRACAAYNTVRTAVALQTRADVGTDPIASQAVAANARLAMAVGGQHLVDNLSPAVPPELAELLRSLATDLQNLTINALAGTAGDDVSQVDRLRDIEADSAKIVELCE